MHSNEEPPMTVIVDGGGGGGGGGGQQQQQQQQQKMPRSGSQRLRKTSSSSAKAAIPVPAATATAGTMQRAHRQPSNASATASTDSRRRRYPGKSERHDRQDRQERQDRPDRQERQDRPDRQERQDRHDRQDRQERQEQMPRRRAGRRHSGASSLSDAVASTAGRGRHRREARSGAISSSTASSCNGSCSSDDGDSSHTSSSSSSSSSGEPNLPYPGFPEISMKALTQYTRPRNWCLMLITNPWFERVSILVILLNCITLGMYQPCVDDACVTNRCKILQIFDDIIFAFFALEMTIKMVAMGMCGKNTYLADSWNRLDFFIVLAGLLEYVMHVENLNLTAIRTIRVLRPLRAINRIPSMRILVMLLLDTLPMLGNVLLLCFFVFFIFGIIGVQLWQGILRQRCTLDCPEGMIYPITGLPEVYRVRVRVNSKNHQFLLQSLSQYYEFSKDQDYICSTPSDSGMHLCGNFPPYRSGSMVCNEEAKLFDFNEPTNTSCVNWNQYYTTCKQTGENPFQGTISFDNIGMAWVAIFLVISLEGWTDIMYYVQDAHSFWDWIYFVLLIVIGSFFMINLCLVVIATQFSETKKREMERMRQERARYTSTSTLASSTNNSEPATCYAEIVKYIAHLWRRFKRRMLKKYRLYKYQRQQRKEGLLPNADNLTFSPSRIKCHHPKCPKYSNRKHPSSIQDQMITVMVPLNSNSNSNNNNNNTNNHNGSTNTNATNNVPSCTTVALVNGINGSTASVTMSTAQHQQAAQQQQQQQQQHSSSDNTEQSMGEAACGGGGMVMPRSSSLKKSSHHQLKPEGSAGEQKTILLKFPQQIMDSEQLISHPCTSGFLSPPTSASRRPSVMFNEYVLLHTPPALSTEPTLAPGSASPAATTTTVATVAGTAAAAAAAAATSSSPAASAAGPGGSHNHTNHNLNNNNQNGSGSGSGAAAVPDKSTTIFSTEKMTQAGDGSIWQVNLPQTIGTIANPYADCSELGIHDAMTCQELLAFSVAFSAALPTGQSTLESFYTSLARCDPHTAEALKAQHKRAPATSQALVSVQSPGHFQAAPDQAAGGAVDAFELNGAPSTVAAVSAAVGPGESQATTHHRQRREHHSHPQHQHQHQHHHNNNNNSHSRNNNGHRSRGHTSHGQGHGRDHGGPTGNYMEDYACCYDLYQNALSPLEERHHQRSAAMRGLIAVYRCVSRICSYVRRYIRRLVEHKYFQQGILLAILINTLSMGIEYHNQPPELTAIVETSNIVFSGIFAVEMLLKVVAEGPFRYIANGFNVFDGIIVILSAIEICQQFLGNGTGGGGSGLSVLRTFRLLRILKLVRFMPNLRRQLFVMLRTMDNVAVFFSLLVLFIFIFSILGMYLFGGKFCKFLDESGLERECTCPEIISRHPQCECDRKHFNNILWATVTVFQILTQEDWNVVLFNGMEKTSHWAALYFVALMTFGNYVLFNLLVAILVEGFSSERNERREREQRELVKKLREETLAENYSDGMYDESRSEADSSTTNDSYYEVRNRWRSAEDVRKLQDSAELIIEAKSNMHRQRLLQPSHDYQINELPTPGGAPSSGITASGQDKEAGGGGSGASNILKLMPHEEGSSSKPRGGLKKTYSVKDRRSEASRLSKIRLVREPPIITTTAATPQDSPSTTLEPGMTFRQWGDMEPPPPPSPSLLRPPNIFTGGQRTLDEGIPAIDLIPPSPVLAHKPLNILNASQLGVGVGGGMGIGMGMSMGIAGGTGSTGSSMHSVIIDDISKSSGSTAAATPIYVPTISSSSTAGGLGGLQPPIGPSTAHTESHSYSHSLNDLTGSMTVHGPGTGIGPGPGPATSAGASTSGSSSSERLPLTPSTSPYSGIGGGSFKQRFRRSSSKKRRPQPTAAAEDSISGHDEEEQQQQLNNGSDNSFLLRSSAGGGLGGGGAGAGSGSGNAGGAAKDTNRLSPQNSIRRLSNTLSIGSGSSPGAALGSRRASACIFNSQVYQNLNQPPKLRPGTGQRRMSSIELAFSKTSHLNLHNLEANRKSLSYTNSKMDLDKWQRSYGNLNEPDNMLQQYIEARDKRKTSISHYNLKKRLEEKELQQLQQLHQQQLLLQQQQQDSSSSSQQQPQSQSHRLSKEFQHMALQPHSMMTSGGRMSKLKMIIERLTPTQFAMERESYSMYVFPEDNKFRQVCTWFVNQKWFDNVVLLFIALNCITLAMERPNIPPTSTERLFLSTANYVFTAVFTVEMFIKVVATGMFYGTDAYFTSGWNIMDGSLVTISIIDLLMSLISESSPRIFGILRVFRLLRSLRPLRVINRAPGLKLVVQTLLSSLRPIGNIVLICCTFFIIFGILGVQLFKGTFFYCEGENIKNVRNADECRRIPGNVWTNRKYNFDDLGKALMSLFVLSSRDGWVNIMYTGLDAVGVDQQPIVNYNEWRLLYFIAFILLVGFFVLNMFVGVVVENFHRCREEQEKEEKIRRAAKRALQMEKKRRRMHEPPYYTNYSPTRMFVHNVVTSKYFDLAIAAVIGLNVVTMAMEYYKMKMALQYALKIFNYFFTAVFILEANMKLVALGWKLYLKDRWNQLDVGIVLLSIVGIVLEELETKIIPINPTIIRVMRVLRIARVLKLLKMAKGIRALLDTVMQALPQVGNLGLLFFLLFFIFAALGVELFGRLECSDEIPCQGLGEHAHFANFGMAFLTLFRVATGDNWNGIMKDTLRDNCDDAADCVRNCCVSSVIAPIFFVIFVLMAQFVLVNVVVAVLMKHLEESHKQMEDELDMEVELERELVREQEFAQEQKLCQQLAEAQAKAAAPPRPLAKVKSLPKNFIYSTPSLDKKFPSPQSLTSSAATNLNQLQQQNPSTSTSTSPGLGGLAQRGVTAGAGGRRQTVQYFNQPQSGPGLGLGLGLGLSLAEMGGTLTPQALSARLGEPFGGASTATAAGGGTCAGFAQEPGNLQLPPLGRRGRRASAAAGFRKRGVLSKERSLDEQAIRRRNLEAKRTSCDSLPWGGDALDYRRGTIFESLESDGGGGGLGSGSGSAGSPLGFDIRSVRSADVPHLEPDTDALAVVSALVPAATPMPLSMPLALPMPTPTPTPSSTPTGMSSAHHPPPRRPFGWSQSVDQGCLLGAPGRSSLLLSVPRSMPPRSRSGSTKQLFKQQALDEDADMDENSLLLPAVSGGAVGGATPTVAAALESVAAASAVDSHLLPGKSDSADILRIISERRRMDQRDQRDPRDDVEDRDSDYNELLLVKSPQSSMD
ncbi:voltage-dependent T-type calcium channel subunit alpha-1G isoform X3 [Drosophila pseudoobscura]|uniref:Voltage-dependent T-type calcium channel subunit alpha-1G isoform X3 n=1 Tax=Drosophila pseudoobscura pseudoobscura TaxID=46245 RepID=A0A6I8W446_DROPS|nr:voltage-dependent T-type calcium channel subunit alpha-1G isoform X3 [Drosophila pseudoobscura]